MTYNPKQSSTISELASFNLTPLPGSGWLVSGITKAGTPTLLAALTTVHDLTLWLAKHLPEPEAIAIPEIKPDLKPYDDQDIPSKVVYRQTPTPMIPEEQHLYGQYSNYGGSLSNSTQDALHMARTQQSALAAQNWGRGIMGKQQPSSIIDQDLSWVSLNNTYP